MADEAKFCSPICSTFEVSIMRCSQEFSWRRTGPILLTNVSCSHCSFLVQLTICWAYFSDVMVSLGLRKPEWSNGEQTTKQWPWPFFDASLTLGRALELFLSPTHWAGHCQFFFFYKIHFMLHITVWEMVCCCYAE